MNTAEPPSSRPRVLLVDDDRDVHQAVSILLARAGIDLTSAMTPEEAYSALRLAPTDVILLDLNFMRGQTQGEEGFGALDRLLCEDPDAVVTIITGQSGIRIAVAAMQAGAFDFVMKPWRNQDLLERVQAAIAHRRKRAEQAELRKPGEARSDPPRLLGVSEGIARLRDLIRRAGPTTANVLVVGPPGSGRSLAARAVHHASASAASEMVILDARAAADPGDQLAAADMARAAHGAVLLRHVDRLDEAAQERLVVRLAANTRVIATASSAETLSPAFRARTGTVEIHIPPLGRRGEDALLLARHFVRAAERRHGRPTPGLTPEVEAAIATAHWADDVRGLEQAIERAVILGDGGPISEADLGLGTTTAMEAAGSSSQIPSNISLRDSERTLVAAALKRHGFNVSRAAEDLGLSRAALYRRMAKHGL